MRYSVYRHKVVLFLIIVISVGCVTEIQEEITDEFLEFECLFDGYYYNNEKKSLPDLLNDYILLGTDIDISMEILVSIANQYDFIKPVTLQELHIQRIRNRYQHAVFELSEPFDCETITGMLEYLKLYDDIKYAHFTMHAEHCVDDTGWPIGDCVMRYGALILLKVPDAVDLSDLEKVAEETNISIAFQYPYLENWYALFADKYSKKGDALRMANYLFETGLFNSVLPNLGLIPKRNEDGEGSE